MLLCKTCDRFSHAECYRTDDLAKEHICGGCAVKTGVNCSNPEIQNFLSKQDQTQEEKTKFLFDLAVRRVLNSILREEFKLTQPGIEPSVSFLKIKFGISSSYANKILVHIFKSGFITLFGGFKMDEEMIRNYTMGTHDDSGFIESNGKPKENEDQDTEEEKKINKSSQGESTEKIGDPDIEKNVYSEHLYRKKFMWPESYVNRESRKDSEPLEPIEPMDIGKKSVRPFFGQIVENLGPRLNSNEKKSWNLCFKVARKGESVQVWSFGTEQEIKYLNEKIKIDSYMVFWGNYTVSPNTSNNLNPTSDWVIKIPAKLNCLETVKLIVSKTQLSASGVSSIPRKNSPHNLNRQRRYLQRNGEKNIPMKIKNESSWKKLKKR